MQGAAIDKIISHIEFDNCDGNKGMGKILIRLSVCDETSKAIFSKKSMV